MSKALSRIERWLEVHAPKLHGALGPGADRHQLMILERQLDAALPGSVASALARHDGQDGLGWPVLGTWELLGCADVASVWRDWAPRDRGRDPAVEVHGPVRQQIFSRGWIPLAREPSGDLLCADTSPVPGGRRGQIIQLTSARSRSVIAPDWERWLLRFANELEAGKWAVNPLLGRLYPA